MSTIRAPRIATEPGLTVGRLNPTAAWPTGHAAVFALALAVLLGHHLWGFYGHFGFDDMQYSKLAREWLAGDFDVGNLYSYRVVPIAAWALSYAALGVNDFASAVPSMLATALTIGLMGYRLRDLSWPYYLLALSAYFVAPWTLFYSDKLMPDSMLAAPLFLAWGLASGVSTRVGGVLAGAGAGLVLFAAFNIKGTVLLAAPLFLVYLISDLLARRRYGFWLGLVGTSAALLGVYLLMCWGLLGDPLARFSAISAGNYMSDCAYDRLPFDRTVARWTTGFWSLLLSSNLYLYLALAAVATGAWWAGRRQQPAQLRLYLGTVLLSFAAMNFMSVSLAGYSPICLDARHFILFSPIIVYCLVRLVALGVASLTGTAELSPLASALMVLLALTGALPGYRQAVYSRSLNYTDVRSATRETLANVPSGSTVYGSTVGVNYLGYVAAGFAERPQHELKGVTSARPCTLDSRAPAAYLFTNWYLDWHSDPNLPNMIDSLSALGYRAEPTTLAGAPVTVYRLRCSVSDAEQ